MSRRVPLSGKRGAGQFIIVDNDDFEWVSRWRWYMCQGYAVREDWNGGREKRFTIRLHRALAERWGWNIDNKMIDHINHDRTDNRKQNLRIVDNAQNMQNRSGPARHNKSGYLGVSKISRRNFWFARIKTYGKVVYLGIYRTPEEAAKAYDKAAKELHGQYATLNFPNLDDA